MTEASLQNPGVRAIGYEQLLGARKPLSPSIRWNKLQKEFGFCLDPAKVQRSIANPPEPSNERMLVFRSKLIDSALWGLEFTRYLANHGKQELGTETSHIEKANLLGFLRSRAQGSL
ncbi:predicted protein [Histoplasma capsulatum H143]|uniref:Uncharacterized protein n=1 Tax=Ajellomyces capsulatus (strain H143) TaxID=544712 RepID=C6H4B1_AJECH|nr:predicted protein [Histoplasma capsulatum H143]